MMTLRRYDHTRNMARFYALTLEQSLFGEFILVRRWGRIGTYGRKAEIWFPAADAAWAELSRIVVAKIKRGYSAVAPASQSAHSPEV